MNFDELMEIKTQKTSSAIQICMSNRLWSSENAIVTLVRTVMMSILTVQIEQRGSEDEKEEKIVNLRI